MSVLEHIAELRLRLLISAGALLVAAIICFANIEAKLYLEKAWQKDTELVVQQEAERALEKHGSS